MPSFSLRHPYFIVVICLFVCVLGLTSVVQMPVDMSLRLTSLLCW